MPHTNSTIVIIGGTSGIGFALAKSYVERGCDVIITGRDANRAQSVAESLLQSLRTAGAGEPGAISGSAIVGESGPGGGQREAGESVPDGGRGTVGESGPIGGRGTIGTVKGLGVDVANPATIAEALRQIDHVDHVVLAAHERDRNPIAEYDFTRAMRVTTLKLVGYAEVVHALLPKMPRRVESSVVLFGGMAREVPYGGSATVSTISAGLSGLMRNMALELSPIRVNAVHPGLVGDTPTWQTATDFINGIVAKTPTKRITHTADVVQTVHFLQDNLGINAVEIAVDGGMRVQPM